MARPKNTTQDIFERIVEDVVKEYLSSGDFNGFDWSFHENIPEFTRQTLKELVRPLIASGRLSGRYEEFHTNPFIKRMPDASVEREIEMLEASQMNLVRLYPTMAEMKGRVRANRYPGKPYCLALARGEAQLSPRYFDLTVLEQYRNDPRYWVRISDVSGSIHIGEGEHAREADEVFLSTFGFGYDEHFNRSVLVPLRYLRSLSPEHQQLWKARELTGGYFPHPDFYTASIVGMWPDHIPVIDAILLEISTINEIAQKIGRPVLFRSEFIDERPQGLTFLIRSTAREFGMFVHLLDKVLSENINKEFFGADILLTEERTVKEEKIEVVHKSTLRLLEEWLKAKYPSEPGYPIEEMMRPLKAVRKSRQQPAHRIEKDKFDPKYFHDQRQLLAEVYSSIRGIRQLLGSKPVPIEYDLHEPIRDGKIRLF